MSAIIHIEELRQPPISVGLSADERVALAGNWVAKSVIAPSGTYHAPDLFDLQVQLLDLGIAEDAVVFEFVPANTMHAPQKIGMQAPQGIHAE